MFKFSSLSPSPFHVVPALLVKGPAEFREKNNQLWRARLAATICIQIEVMNMCSIQFHPQGKHGMFLRRLEQRRRAAYRRNFERGCLYHE